MMRNEIAMPRFIRRGRRSTHCSFHRECEALNKGRGIGFCDFDGNETICDGDRCFCNKLDALRDYFLKIGKKIGKKDEVSESVQEPVKATLGTVEETAKLGDKGSRRQCPGVSVALPLEYWKKNDASTHAGVSGTLDERGLLLYSVFGDLCVSQELAIRVFFPNGYELDSFKVIAAVTWKKAHSEADWKGYTYGLDLIHISRADREKLKLLLRNVMTDQTPHSESDPGRGALA
jgi:hypothetical protein